MIVANRMTPPRYLLGPSRQSSRWEHTAKIVRPPPDTLNHVPAARPVQTRLVAGQREKAEKSVSALSQIAWMTWSGVSSCGECPVSGSSWNRAMGIAAA
jgi:hypothetical protein